ncbi:unnamed protein product, partial [Closterium sp. NIES-54]
TLRRKLVLGVHPSHSTPSPHQPCKRAQHLLLHIIVAVADVDRTNLANGNRAPVEIQKVQRLRQEVCRLLGSRDVLQYELPAHHHVLQPGMASLHVLEVARMGLVLGGRGPVVLTGHADASWVDDSATQRSSQGYTFSLDSGSISWRSTRSSSVLSSTCEAEIYAGAMAAQELHWLTYLLSDLGEQPRVLYVDNKAMIALCQQHRTKHIVLRYFLARKLQQRGQLHLAYVATRVNTSDVFTKALPPSDHQRFATVLGLVPTFVRELA